MSLQDMGRDMRISFGLESESDDGLDIEIEPQTVVINTDETAEEEIAELAESQNELASIDNDMEDAEEAEATLESLVFGLEQQLLRGGMTKATAAFANIGLESVASKLKLDDREFLNASLEDVSEDGEAETEKVLDKAKTMLKDIKDVSFAFVNKMYVSVSAILGNSYNYSLKIMSRAKELSNTIDTGIDGGQTIKIGKGKSKYFYVDGKLLNGDQYLKELDATLSLIKTAITANAETQPLKEFATEAARYYAGASSSLDGKNVVKYVSRLNSLTPHSDNMMVEDEGNEHALESFVSDGLLGDYVVYSIRPKKWVVEEAIKEQQTGVGMDVAYKRKMKIPERVFKAVVGSIFVHLPIGRDLLYSSIKGTTEDKKNVNAGEAVVLCTEFGLYRPLKFNLPGREEVESLSGSEAKKAVEIVSSHAGIVTGMGKIVKERNNVAAALKTLNKHITDNLSEEDQERKSDIKVDVYMATNFIKTWLRNMMRFESDAVSYSVNVMNAAVVYAEKSANAKQSSSDKEQNDE